MTTEEIKNKLKISENTCIHCQTLELAIQVLSIFHQSGLRWKSETPYTLNHNWDSFKESTVYYPFRGECSSFSFANLTGYIIIRAEEFIALHTEEKEFNLENYEPKGELIGFPKEIIARMLNYQEEQGNPRDISVFEKQCEAGRGYKGFNWAETQENCEFWYEVISDKNFDVFFTRYPKKQDYQDNSQKFRVGDKVMYYITNKIGIIEEVKKHKFDNDIDIVVDFGNNDICEYEVNSDIIRPFLLHYRDDFDYDVIDFNNLPKRQKPKRWRAKKEIFIIVLHQTLK